MLKKIRQWLIIAGVVVALFIPTYIAVISYYVINSMPEPVNADNYDILIVAPDGKRLDIGDADLKKVKEIFLEMRRDATLSEVSDFSGGVCYSVSLLGEEGGEYSFFFFDDADGYMLDGDNVYELEKKDVERFLNTEYSAAMFRNSSLPQLLSGGTGAILPHTAEWKYAGYKGRMLDASVKLRDSVETYTHSGNIELSFSLEPSECTITVRSGTEVLYSGDFSSYRTKIFDETHILEYEISVAWNENGYSGRADYHFYGAIGKPAEFEIYYGEYEDTDGEKYIEFVEITGYNVGILEDSIILVTPSLEVQPVFRSDGSCVRALIPFGNEAEEGEYKILAVYRGSRKEFSFDYVKRNVSDRKDFYPAESVETVEKYRKGYLDLIGKVCSVNSETVYMSGDFIDPDPDGIESVYGDCTLIVGFGRTLYLEESEKGYKNDGVYYQTSGGVYALNDGKVVKTGEDDWLGKYVVVDHGLGLKTWYCNLLSVDVNEGDTVEKAQNVGTAGNSGYTSKDYFGFYLMTTLDGVPISPYALFEGGVKVNETLG